MSNNAVEEAEKAYQAQFKKKVDLFAGMTSRHRKGKLPPAIRKAKKKDERKRRKKNRKSVR